MVSFLYEVRNSAANCGSLFWMNEFGNQVYASTVPPMLPNVYGAVYCDCALHVASAAWKAVPFWHAWIVICPEYAAYAPPCGWYWPCRPRYSRVTDDVSLKR